MSDYTDFLIAFHCDDHDAVAEIARHHLETTQESAHEGIWEGRYGWGGRWEATQYLADLASRSGPNRGPKGGLSLWGIVGKDTDPNEFVDILRPFWDELLRTGNEGGPLPTDRVIVLWQSQSDDHAWAREILLTGQSIRGLRKTGELVIGPARALPISWSYHGARPTEDLLHVGGRGRTPQAPALSISAKRETVEELRQAIGRVGFEFSEPPRIARTRFDLAWRSDGRFYVAEVEEIRPTTEKMRIPPAVGRLLFAREQLSVDGRTIIPVLATNEPPTDPALVEFVTSKDVVFLWPERWDSWISGESRKNIRGPNHDH